MPEGWGGSGVIEIDRVKTPALAFACRRESEIRDFVPAGYFEFAATAQAEGGTFWMPAAPTAGPDSLSREGAQAVLEGARGFEESISAGRRVVDSCGRPPRLHDLPLLQKMCSARFGGVVIAIDTISDSQCRAGTSLQEHIREADGNSRW